MQQPSSEPSSQLVTTIIIIGGGYAALTCVEELRKNQKADQPLRLLVFSREHFCTRPELFFGLKQLSQIDSDRVKQFGTFDMQEFIKKHDVEWHVETQVVALNRELRRITVRDVSAQLTEYTLDKLIFATGGVPNVANYPVEIVEVTPGSLASAVAADSRAIACSPIVRDLLLQSQHPYGSLLIRNIEEVSIFIEMIKNMYTLNKQLGRRAQDRNKDDVDVVVVGAGALAIDVITSVLDGYVALSSSKTKEDSFFAETDFLPTLLVLSRHESRRRIGFSLLQYEDACDIVLLRANSKNLEYHRFVRFETGAVVQAIQVANDRVCGVRIQTTAGTQNIRCQALVQAIGVSPNSSLAKESGLAIGNAHNGVLVDDRFRVLDAQTLLAVDNIFAVGDCAEIDIKHQTIGGHEAREMTGSIVWKNWTSAREMAQQCVLCVLNQQHDTETLWFNQTLRIFGLYVACLGNYGIQQQDESNSNSTAHVVVKVRSGSEGDAASLALIKLVFRRIAGASVRLVGALILGPDLKYYRYGQSILQLIRAEVDLPEQMVQPLAQIEQFDLGALVKLATSSPKPSSDHLAQLLSQDKFKIATDAPKKVFKNPLARKAKAQQQVAQASSDDALSQQMQQMNISSKDG